MGVLLTDLDNGVLTLTMNRPEALNAMTAELQAALAEALCKAAGNAAVRAVVITGAGRAFSVGQDLKDLEGAEIRYREVVGRYRPVVLGIVELEKPVIAAINGVAAGASLSFALACDIRLASSAATLTPAFSRIGLAPDAGMSYFFPRLVGWSQAFELLALSPRISADEALRLGLVNHVFPAEQFTDDVKRFAATLAQGPTKALGLTKRTLSKSEHATLGEILEYEAQIQEIAGRSPDAQEGIAAFREKRQPVFTGDEH